MIISNDCSVLYSYVIFVLPNLSCALFVVRFTFLPKVIIDEFELSLVSWIEEIPDFLKCYCAFGSRVTIPIFPGTWSVL